MFFISRTLFCLSILWVCNKTRIATFSPRPSRLIPMEAFQLLSRGGTFNKSRFRNDVQLFTVSPPFSVENSALNVSSREQQKRRYCILNLEPISPLLWTFLNTQKGKVKALVWVGLRLARKVIVMRSHVSGKRGLVLKRMKCVLLHHLCVTRLLPKANAYLSNLAHSKRWNNASKLRAMLWIMCFHVDIQSRRPSSVSEFQF